MMPPEQETNIAPNNIQAITNRPENNESPEGSSSTNKVKPSSDDNGSSPKFQPHDPITTPTTSSFSILHQSLRPVTLKVLIINTLSSIK